MEDKQHRFKWLRLAIVLWGAFMIIFAIGADKIGLVGAGIGVGKISIGLSGLALLGLGGFLRPQDLKDRYSLARRMRDGYRGVAILVLNTLILWVCLELGATWGPQLVRSAGLDPNSALIAVTMPYFQSQSWGRQYWHDLSLYDSQYQPYVLWRGAPMTSVTINVDKAGLRQTPGADCRAGSYQVFVFGGSTMWGSGAPDWGTIPAYLQQGLQATQVRPVCVVNFGQIGFVSTQSLIILLTQLEAGNIPDLVIFYDGLNDVYSAYSSGQAGVHISFQSIAQRVEGRHTLLGFLEASALFKLLQGWFFNSPVTYQTKDIAAGPLADSIVQIYFGNYEIVEMLAQRYGFDYVFFWQPALPMGKKPLTPVESMIKDTLDPALVSLYAESYQRARLAGTEHQHFYDISDSLDDQTAPLWFDPFHIVPVGNQVIAQRMLEIISKQQVEK